jgi:glycosyltransferase involved in cell wall biosynthesis
MKIAYITAGAAGMYCGSCMHDNTLAAALQNLGHECLLIPTYTPIRTDERDVSIDRIFFGGINVYLEQRSAIFRRMPGWLGRLLSLPRLLRWVSRFAVNTQPQNLGPMTVSMLQGVNGRQEREVRLLVDFLASDFQPQVVCLTNALLSGIIPALKRRLQVPIVVTLQGDDIFLEYLPEPYKRQAIELIRDNCTQANLYIATSSYYADFMSVYLGLPRGLMHVVHPGLNLEGFSRAGCDAPPLSAAGDAGSARRATLGNVGYLARICPEKGSPAICPKTSAAISPACGVWPIARGGAATSISSVKWITWARSGFYAAWICSACRQCTASRRVCTCSRPGPAAYR